MSPTPLPPPSAQQAISAAVQFALAMVLAAWCVRPMLRDPRFPRWVSVVIVVAVPQIVMLALREMVSHQEYHTGLREGVWVFVWVSVEISAYCVALLWGNHLIPLKIALITAEPQRLDVLAVVSAESGRQRAEIDSHASTPSQAKAAAPRRAPKQRAAPKPVSRKRAATTSHKKR